MRMLFSLLVLISLSEADEQEPAARAILIGHKEAVATVAFHPTAKVLASGGHDGGLILWDLATAKQIDVLLEPRARTNLSDVLVHDSVKSVVFTSDGKTLVTKGLKKVTVWDLATRRGQVIPHGHTSTIAHLAVDPSDRTVATAGSSDKTVKLWDSTTLQQLASWKSEDGNFSGLAYSADGKTLATATVKLFTSKATVRFWDIPGGQLRATLYGHEDTRVVSGFLAGWKNPGHCRSRQYDQALGCGDGGRNRHTARRRTSERPSEILAGWEDAGEWQRPVDKAVGCCQW